MRLIDLALSFAAGAALAPSPSSFLGYNYDPVSAGSIASGCSADDLKKTTFRSQEKFFKRIGYCLARNPHMAINARSTLRLTPHNCPKNDRLYFPIPQELENIWSIPAREPLVLEGLDLTNEDQVTVSLTSATMPCVGRAKESINREPRNAANLTLPETLLSRNYLLIDGLSAEARRSITALNTRITLRVGPATPTEKNGVFYCQSGCCGASSKCSNMELRSISDPQALIRRANSCIRKFAPLCEITSRDVMTFNFDIEDVFLCGDNSISLNLGFTATQFTVPSGGEITMGLVPTPPANASGTITFSQARIPCGDDAKVWFKAGYSQAKKNFVITQVMDLSFAKPYLTLTSNDIEIYDSYSLTLPLSFRSSVPDTEVRHQEYYGM